MKFLFIILLLASCSIMRHQSSTLHLQEAVQARRMYGYIVAIIEHHEKKLVYWYSQEYILWVTEEPLSFPYKVGEGGIILFKK